MKVLLVNGSPHKNGCTNTALEIAGNALDIAGEYDGFIFGAPVHFASAAASIRA